METATRIKTSNKKTSTSISTTVVRLSCPLTMYVTALWTDPV